MTKLRVLSLFAGIGGFDLGLERTGGFETVAFCEVKPYARRVLEKNWPGVPIYGDIRGLTAERLAADGIAVGAICGGFPCQDISPVGTRIGIGGLRSGLWGEYARLVCELRPRFVFVENSADLLRRGLGDVLGSLAECGYDAEWSIFSACRMGAPHARDRLFLVAYPNGEREKAGGAKGNGHGAAPHARRVRPEHIHSSALAIGRTVWTAPAGEPGLARVAHGVPNRVDRNDALGNAVVPQIPELIGRAILASLEEQAA
jgi:DNA (cytosine-5)-methyltransferase 1